MKKVLVYLLTKDEKMKGLWPLEWAAVVYIAVTLFIMAILNTRLEEPVQMLLTRGIVLVAIAVVWFLYNRYPNRLTTYLRMCTPFALLSQLYPDTYEFCRCFDNMDYVFAGLDQQLFGCQPSLVFSQLCPWHWFSEALNMGYSSYFFLIWLAVTWFWIKRPEYLQRAGFVILASFFLYYMVYIFLPVAGPQFYYQAEGVDAAAGVFPELGRYFNTHTEMYPSPSNEGLFANMVHLAHEAGERPTAAFPSSHIGVSTILLLLAFRYKLKDLGIVLLPFYLLLCAATVYIHAHYLVDAICGFITSIPVFFFVEWLYRRLFLARSSSR